MYSFSLQVHVYYDDSFSTRFGPNISSIVTRVNAVFSMVRTIYSHKISLTTVLIPMVTKIEHQGETTWKATENDLR